MKDSMIRIRISESDKSAIKEKADELGLSMSAYITMIIKQSLK